MALSNYHFKYESAIIFYSQQTRKKIDQNVMQYTLKYNLGRSVYLKMNQASDFHQVLFLIL